MERMQGKVVIVAGGAGGIGSVLSLGLASEGAHVVVADVDEQQNERVLAELSQRGPACAAIRVDVTDEESTVAMAKRTVEQFGQIDVLVYAAAIYATLERRDFVEIGSDEWDLVLKVNLTGAQRTARAVLPAMQERGEGSIVNITSVNTVLSPAGRAHYSASKAALENLTRTLAKEAGPYGVRVNALSPGLVNTGRAKLVSEERYKQTAEDRALKRELVPQDLIGPLVFLCSEDAAMITGHTLVVDGGQIFV